MQIIPCTINQVVPVPEKIPFVPEPKAYTIQQVFEDLCKALDLPYKKVVGKSQKREYVTARMIGCVVVKKKLGATRKATGDFLSRDHTTIINSLQVASDLIDAQDAGYMSKWNQYLQNSQLYNANDFR